MSFVNVSSLASDVLHIFGKTLAFFENVGVLQVYSFNHSDVFFSPIANKYLENFIALLEEITDVLNKLKSLPKESVNSSNSNTNMVPGDLITAANYMQTTDIFVTEHLITPVTNHLAQPHDELRSYITPPTTLSIDFTVPEPATTPSWIPPEDKDEPDEQEKEDAVTLREKTGRNHSCEENEKFHCSMCNKGFSSEANMKYHVISHRDDYLSLEDAEKFQCVECNKLLCSKTSLKSHWATHTGQKPFCCEHCGKLFTTNLNLAAHLTRQHNLNTESANSCSECGKLFVRKSALDTHMKCHMGVKPWACNYCDKTFTQKVTRDIHLLTHTRNYKFCCGECGKRFPTQAKLNYHHKTHGKPQFTCSLCNKKFTTRQYLNAHYRTHDAEVHCRLDTVSCQISENKFGCLQCNLVFSSQHKLALHSDKHNPLSTRYRYMEKLKMVPRQKHSCLVCGKEFMLKASLSHHQQQNHPKNVVEKQQRKISCNICHKQFTMKRKLQRHMLIHTQNEQHACAVCGRMFLRKDSLQRHASIHLSKPKLNSCAKSTESHKCSRCGKSFRSKTALKFHNLSHDGKFKYQCSVCGRQFVRKCHYQGHLFSHSADRPYKCDTCGKSFKHIKTCREHSKRVHKEQTQVVNKDQTTTSRMAAPQLSACEMAASQLTIQSLLAGDDATYGQTYDQFQACVQLQ